MDKVYLAKYPQRCWHVADIHKGNEIIPINRFYSIDKDFICIYNTMGGSGYGYSPGDVIQKVYIGDCEFEEIAVHE